MPSYRPAIALHELPEHGFKAVDIDGQSLLVGRVGGRLFACLDRCPHAGAPLRLGKLRGEELQCMRHGWIFNVVTGACVPDDPAFRLTQVPTKLDAGQVLVEL